MQSSDEFKSLKASFGSVRRSCFCPLATVRWCVCVFSLVCAPVPSLKPLLNPHLHSSSEGRSVCQICSFRLHKCQSFLLPPSV